MTFNASKCSVLRVNRPRCKSLAFNYNLKGETLAQAQSTPYLGVNIAETLQWENHVTRVASKANSTLGFLRRNLKDCPKKLKETAYFSMVRPTLEYACAVWDPFRQNDIKKLDKIQRAAARFVSGNYQKKTSVTAIQNELGWTDLQVRRKHSRLIVMYKILNGLVAIPRVTY